MVRESTKSNKTGVLLVNLGSPDAPTTSAIRRYLKSFLWDPRVVNLPRFIWWLILHYFILPFRPRKLTNAYKKIWQDKGSPLTFLTQQLADKVASQFEGETYLIDAAMRYGKPLIAKQLEYYKIQQIDQLIVIPLYPQYSSTTTASVYDEVARCLSKWWHIPGIQFVSDYHQNDYYIAAIADSVEKQWQETGQSELLLMSFHGLPEKLTEWGEPYFDQCHRSAELIAEKLSLSQQQWKVVFQSRFGKAKWLQPYCVEALQALPGQGIKKVDVICPGFAVDCLETLEEIEIVNKQIFLAAGGESYHYIPALNDSAKHVETVVALIKEHA
ncbi:MAG: ferrochelatase [Methylococcales bacterium]|nr:ferrochelatase [Methylococcales bacterium]